MNTDQSLAGGNASQFSNTGNPQNIGTPSLTPPPSASNLQSLSATGGGLNTSGTTGITLSSPHTLFTPDTTPPPSKPHHPYLLGGLIVIVVLSALVVASLLWARKANTE